MPRDFHGHCGLQAGERKITIRPSHHRARKRVSGAIAGRGQTFQRRSSRPGQAKQFPDFVERLAGRVVHSAAQPTVAPDALDRHALAMAAGHQQQQIRERDLAALADQAGQPGRERVRFQMVDRDIRQVFRQGDAFGHPGTDDQATDQTRPGAGRHAAEFGEADPGAVHHAAHQIRQMGEMGAGGDFGHHPAIGRVLAFLAQHCLRQDAPVGGQHRRRRLVAGTLDPQHGAGLHCLVFPLLPAGNRTRT